MDVPAERVAIVTRMVLPPIYGPWASRSGYEPPPSRPIRRAEITIRAPADGARLRLDPDVPPSHRTLALRAAVAPNVPEVVWYVDGEPFRRATYPYEARWLLEPGTHRFQARFPNAAVASQTVTITVD